MPRKSAPLGALLIALCSCTLGAEDGARRTSAWRIAESVEVDKVPSWFPVGFSLLTHGKVQYLAYYNEKHQMIVALRKIGEKQFQKVELPSKIGWDSHNYVTMAVDSAGCVHLSGNMHGVPLIYFRTQKPGDIATFQRMPMTGKGEDRCTYPRFLKDPDGNLLFHYRLGGSGNGMRLWNRYDPDSGTWSRFLDTPMFDGRGKCNAYPIGPVKGPDGLFHIVWVWRETPDCATNHDLSYARSRDLKKWETAGGAAVALPMTTDEKRLVVDPIPVNGGIINGGHRLTFDSDNRPVLFYHKLDGKKHMQIFAARFEGGEWKRHPVTDWEKDVPFSGRGAMPFIGISISAPVRLGPERLCVGYRHRDYGSGRIIVDDSTLKPVNEKISVPNETPPGFGRPEIDFEGIAMRSAGDLGDSGDEDVKYVLRWETLPAHYDRPRRPPLPPAGTLRLIRLERN